MDEYYEEKLEFFEAEGNLPFSVFLQNNASEWHYHRYLELIYCVEGLSIIMVGQQCLECMKGDFIIVHTMEPHLTRPASTNSQLLCVQIDLSIMDNTYGSFYESQFFLSFIKGEAPYKQHIRTQRGTLLESILSELLIEYQQKKQGYEMCIRGNFLRLFIYLIRNKFIEIIDNQQNNKDMERIRPVLDYLEKEINSDISVAKAASIAHMSYYHFCRLFKKVTGKTFVEYQNFIRLKKAEKLLVTTSMTVTDIAYETGFGSVAYFARFYKRETGQSPTSFRKKFITPIKG